VVSVLVEQTLEANTAKTIFAESLDIFHSVDLALAVGRIWLIVREHAVAHLIGILAIMLAYLAPINEFHIVLVVVLVGSLHRLRIIVLL
jgi:hypothetical protein